MLPKETASYSIMLMTALLVSGSAISTSASATVITDATNDFIPTFTGTPSGDLDVLSAFATFDGLSFHIGGTVNGNIGTLPTALYVFGFNRGAGTANFASLGLAGVSFDSVITMTGAGVTGGRDIVANVPIIVPAGAAHISGSSFVIDILASILPSEGLPPDQYSVNLWTRDTSSIGNAALADFAPDNSNFAVSPALSVPEPATASLVAAAVAGLLAFRRRRSLNTDY
jgi:hypothetical protein